MPSIVQSLTSSLPSIIPAIGYGPVLSTHRILTGFPALVWYFPSIVINMLALSVIVIVHFAIPKQLLNYTEVLTQCRSAAGSCDLLAPIVRSPIVFPCQRFKVPTSDTRRAITLDGRHEKA